MRVGLIRGLLDSPSIIQYADQILDGFHRYYPEIQIVETRPPSPSSLPIGRIARSVATQTIRFGWYPRHLKKTGGDINHITDHVHAYLVRYVPAERTIVTCHDLTTFVHPQNITSTSLCPSITTKIFQHSISCLHEAVRVIAVSENTKRDILEYSRCTPDQIRVIYHGVDSIFNESADEGKVVAFRKKFAPDASKLVLHVGLNTPYKNVETVLRVLHLLNTDKRQNVRLIKIGADFTAEQQKLIFDLGLTDRVTHLGKIPAEDLVVAYHSCDVLLFPSIYEGFGWPPLEAMACGTPVVASTTGAIPEVVGDAGILQEPTAVGNIAEAVAGLLNNADLRKHMTASGIRRARLFTWKRSISQLAAVYEEIARVPHLQS